VLGFCGLSLVCWQTAIEGYNRKRSLIGLVVSLAATVSNHYYAALAFLPLAIGEVVRSLARRRLDLPMWMAFGSAMTPLLLFLPLIERGKSYNTNFWTQLRWSAILDFYYSLLAPAVVPLLAMPILLAVYPRPAPMSSDRQHQGSRPAPPCHEVAAAVGFIAIPIVAIISAKLITGAFTDRYALSAVIGFSILLAFVTHSLLEGRALIGAVLVLSFCSWFVVQGIRNYQSEVATSLSQAEIYNFLQSASKSSLPIVAMNAHAFMVLTHYGPRELTSRLVYLADPEASLRYLGHNTVDRGMLGLMKPWFHLRVEEYGPYIASQQRFLVYGNLWNFNWLLSELAATDRRIELRGRKGNDLLFLVSPKEQSDGSSLSHSLEKAGPVDSEVRDSIQPSSR
jgi:hypothetical protein